MRLAAAALAFAFVLAACGGPAAVSSGVGPGGTTAGSADSGASDAGTSDGGKVDGGGPGY